MLKPLNKESAFAAIAEDLELPIVLLSSPDPRLRLAMLDKIGAALLGTNLTWRDLAERVTAPRLTTLDPAGAITPSRVQLTASAWPTSEIKVGEGSETGAPAQPISPEQVITAEELVRFGYRGGANRQEGPYAPPPIPPMTEPAKPAPVLDGNRMLSTEELAANYGYMRRPDGGFGYPEDAEITGATTV